MQEELDALNNEIRAMAAHRDSVVQELKQLTAKRNQLEAEQNANQLVDGLSDTQKSALAQSLGLPSISPTTIMGNM